MKRRERRALTGHSRTPQAIPAVATELRFPGRAMVHGDDCPRPPSARTCQTAGAMRNSPWRRGTWRIFLRWFPHVVWGCLAGFLPGLLFSTLFADPGMELGARDGRTGTSTHQPASPSTNALWSLAPIRNPPPPRVRNERWIATPVDRFILARLESEGLEPSLEADRRTLIRRLSFDLHGLPPTFEEVEAFVHDRSGSAVEKVVDRLLASPRYGERWGRHWLDVARYADTKGYVYGDREETRFVHSHAYRDWVVRAHNDDLPFSRFLELQLAADTRATSSADLAALGFLTLGKRFLGVMHDIIDDRIDVVTRGLLGLTVSCARCHDHKYDPVSTQDYYALYGIFASSYEQLTPLRPFEEHGIEKEALQELRARQDKLAAVLQAKRDLLADRLRSQIGRYLEAIPAAASYPTEDFYELRGTNDLNPIFVRRWADFVQRAGAAGHPVFTPWKAFADLARAERTHEFPQALSRLTQQSSANPALAEALAKEPPRSISELAQVYAKVFAKVDRVWRDHSASSNAAPRMADAALESIRQVFHGPESPLAVPPGAVVEIEWYFDEPTRVELSKLQAEIDRWLIKISPSNALPHTVVLKDKLEPKPGRVFRRGNPALAGEEVPPRFLSALDPRQTRFTSGSGRAELAARIADRANPLTARVFVNRVWTHHFGRGLVATPSDFGWRSLPPSHPELLDWLSTWFLNQGGSMKKLHQLIVLSNTYRQSSVDRPEAQARDPENRFLWRMAPRRLDWESLHDSMLFVSGELGQQRGGFAASPKEGGPRPRSIYLPIDRQFLPGSLRNFDFANPDLHTPARPDTTVPQQALFFINSPFAAERARTLARAVLAQGDLAEFFRRAYQRSPSSQELQAAREFLSTSQRSPRLERKPPPPPAWKYGFGSPVVTNGQAKPFQILPHFTDGSWQGGSKWPDDKLGWVRLTATGGHPGNDLNHSSIRRWISPQAMKVEVRGKLVHKAKEGDGVRAWIVHNSKQVLGQWSVHQREQEIALASVEVAAGDTIDFAVDRGPGLSHDDYLWSPVLVEIGPQGESQPRSWDSKQDFSGPPEALPSPFFPAEQLAQVIFSSNEFLFVD